MLPGSYESFRSSANRVWDKPSPPCPDRVDITRFEGAYAMCGGENEMREFDVEVGIPLSSDVNPEFQFAGRGRGLNRTHISYHISQSLAFALTLQYAQ